ncbi:MAG TPA: hypothetical protein VF615_00835 [Longimicrobiaceae bacterium]|jgi:hypothetical protein
MLFRWMRGAGSAAVLAATLPLAGCGEPEDADAIEAAAVAYVQEAGGVPGTAEVEEVSGDHARALVTPKEEGSTDPAWVLLKRENGKWQGLVYGTAIGPEELEDLGIPATLKPD